MATYTGSSIVDYLKSTGKSSDYNTRAKLASQYGISNYSGTSSQNTQLLNLLRGGSSAVAQGTATTGFPAGTSTPIKSTSSSSRTNSSTYVAPKIDTNAILSSVLSGEVSPLNASSYLQSQVKNAYLGSAKKGQELEAEDAYLKSWGSMSNQLNQALQGQGVTYNGQTYVFGQGGQASKASTTVNQSMTGGTTSTSTSALNSYRYVDKNGNVQTIQASSPQQAMSKAPNIASDSGVQLISTGQTTLAKAQPSSSVADVSNFSSISVPTTNYQTQNISSATAATSAYQTMLDQLFAQQKDYQAQLQAEQANQAQTKSTLASFLTGSKTPQQMRDDAYSQTGINPTNYFAEEKAKIAEIGSLTEQYNNVVAQRDQQIAATGDKMASMNFINNQTAQIRNNAAPELNRLSANINSKAAVLQALQGQFSEAETYVKNAVSAQTADYEFKLNALKTFYDMNEDTITRLDSKYQNAFNTALQLAKDEYTRANKEATDVGALMIEYPSAGITISDSLDTAYTKASKTAETISTTKKTTSSSTGGGTSGDGTFTKSQLNTGANNAGMDYSNFSSLPYEVKNYFINTSASNVSKISSAIQSVKTDKDKTSLISEVNSSNLSPVVKNYWLSKINSIKTTPNETVFGKLTNFLKGLVGK